MPVFGQSGPPGTSFTNGTGQVMYQFRASLINTCGICLSYHGQIARWFPIPLHPNCNCRQEPVPPGATAQPFEDFQKFIGNLTERQQKDAVGASNWKLIENKVVKWEDVVSPTRVRTFHEVARDAKLSVADMVKNGVRPDVAQEAYDRVHAPVKAAIAAAGGHMTTQQLQAAGVDVAAIKAGSVAKAAQGLGIGGKPLSGGRRTTIAPSPKPLPSRAVAVAVATAADDELTDEQLALAAYLGVDLSEDD